MPMKRRGQVNFLCFFSPLLPSRLLPLRYLKTPSSGNSQSLPRMWPVFAWNDPRLASKDFGERAIRAIVGRMHDKAEELLAEYPGSKL